jgi:hypothetical protein
MQAALGNLAFELDLKEGKPFSLPDEAIKHIKPQF